MNFLILLFCIVNTMSVNPNINLTQEQLCEHKTDGSGKSDGIVMSTQLPCDWNEMETKSADQIFKFAKKNNETKVMTSSGLSISSLPAGLSASDEQDLLKPEGLKTLSEGFGEVVSTKPLKITNINGGQIIRKDEDHNFYKIYNYFIYKKKLVSISYYIVSASRIDVKEYDDAFDSYLMKTKFN